MKKTKKKPKTLAPKENKVSPSEIMYHFRKTNDFKTIYADGVFGGLTTRGLLDLNFFIERNPIPRVITHEINDGNLGDEKFEFRESLSGTVREVHTGVLLDIKTATSLRNWLDTHINNFHSVSKED